MKKEDLQNSQRGTGSSEQRTNTRDTQKNQTNTPSKDQQEDIAHQAGLGRERMTDIEEMGGMSGRDDYAGGDNDDMSNQSTNERTDND
jgi:hypothetical protein